MLFKNCTKQIMQGGGESEAIDIPDGVEVVKIKIEKGGLNSGHGELLGMRVYLSNGEEAGCLNHLDFPDIPEGNSTTEVLGMLYTHCPEI